MILLNQLGILFNLFTRYIFRHKMLNFQWSKTDEESAELC